MFSVNAQIGNLGIYGSVPEEHEDDIVYVYLQNLYPAYETETDHFRPVNGVGNFNIYYLPDGTSFVPGGTYRVWYFGKDKTTTYGYDVVNYNPNSGHTNGYEVRPFNSTVPPGPPPPLGVHGTVLAKIPGQGGVTTPLSTAVARVGHGGLYPYRAAANGNGYLSIYYSSQDSNEFLPYDVAYDFEISATLPGTNCYYRFQEDRYVIWVPSEGYIAEAGFGTMTLQSQTPGCQP